MSPRSGDEYEAVRPQGSGDQGFCVSTKNSRGPLNRFRGAHQRQQVCGCPSVGRLSLQLPA